MKSVTFITANQAKADYLARYLGMAIDHKKVDQDELQSLELREIVEHKVRQAYDALGTPVLVEDVSLEFAAMGRLPGPFIKFFLHEMSDEAVCRLLDGKDRASTARCGFGYFDGSHMEYFEGSISGTIADHPRGDGGFGWDTFFIPDGYDITRAEMDEQQYQDVYMKIKPLAAVRDFLVRV